MSIEKCSRCDRMIDTDFDCEVYREEFDNEVICDTCYEKAQDAADNYRASRWSGAKSAMSALLMRRHHENEL